MGGSDEQISCEQDSESTRRTNARQVGRGRGGRRVVVGWDERSRRPARAGPEGQARSGPPTPQPARESRQHERWDARPQPSRVGPRDGDVGRLRECSYPLHSHVGDELRRRRLRPAPDADSAGSGTCVWTAPIRRPTPAPRQAAHSQRDGSSSLSLTGGRTAVNSQSLPMRHEPEGGIVSNDT